MGPRTRAESAQIYSKIVERYAHFFERPEVRLRFLHQTLARQTASCERLDAKLERYSSLKRSRAYERLLEWMLYRLIVQELHRLLPTTARERMRLLRRNRAPLAARVFFSFYQIRHAFYAAGLACVAVALFGVYSGAVWTSARVSDYLASRYGKTRGAATAQNPVLTQVSAQHLPDYRPEKVWLVEQKDGHERYSNGGRILTEYETGNHPRAFNLYARGAGEVIEAGRREPVGIVYHTSESDMLPFTADNNDSIETRTRGLLEYVRRNRSYNYLIDRFGQIYRVVRDEEAANHAGNSIWADQRGVYVGLNESFIGVCFETNSTEGGEEKLTEAQLVSGRLLTQILRSRHGLDDANCVTHGLVSVNPDRMLVGFHRDWARDFPFAAFGLSDKYQPPTPALGEFGFTYDGELVDALGGVIWPGARAGEEQFESRAEATGVKADELRKRMRQRYRELMDEQRRLRRDSNANAGEPAGEAE